MRRIGAGLVFCAVALAAGAQTPKVTSEDHRGPATLARKPIVLWDGDVVRHWPKTPNPMNIPATLRTLSPGQCLRIGVLASGKNNEHFLDGAILGFSVRSADATTEIADAPVASIRLIKPEGMDFVQSALAAAHVSTALPFTTTLAASAGRWCVPDDAAAGKVELRTTVVRAGKPMQLEPVTMNLIVPEMPPTPEWKDVDAVGQWDMEYHMHPEPALLGPAIDKLFLSGKISNIALQGFVAAMKQDPACAKRMGPWLAKQNTGTQITTLLALREAGLSLAVPVTLDAEAKATLAKFPPLDDPYLPSPDEAQFEKLDRLWSIFCVTGDREPVDALVSMLAWHKDYAVLERLKTAHASGENTSNTLTPELVHAVAYSAVGWSLQSFQRRDPLASDYLLAIVADPKTPADIRDQLQGMRDNAAFKR